MLLFHDSISTFFKQIPSVRLVCCGVPYYIFDKFKLRVDIRTTRNWSFVVNYLYIIFLHRTCLQAIFIFTEGNNNWLIKHLAFVSPNLSLYLYRVLRNGRPSISGHGVRGNVVQTLYTISYNDSVPYYCTGLDRKNHVSFVLNFFYLVNITHVLLSNPKRQFVNVKFYRRSQTVGFLLNYSLVRKPSVQRKVILCMDF